ncbi:hypothetical protein [Rheinheimera texasensis]|uniref:hypothetical protein n=1 Tax=Rheinheimera texasensis TaxID=306205 RepID=UPI0032B12C51
MQVVHPQLTLTELETRLEMSAFFDGGVATPQDTFRCCGKCNDAPAPTQPTAN